MKTFYRRKLPHWIPPGAIFFVTFRLANSLPIDVMKKLVAEKERDRQLVLNRFSGQDQKNDLQEMKKRYFGHFDAWLDRCLASSPRWLGDPKIAQIVADSLHAFDGQVYQLTAYCIMPNHVHVVLDSQHFEPSISHRGVTAQYPLADILKRLKGRTARYANQVLGRTGGFWQHESYDHVVRDADELERIIWYVLNNPVKAGLVSHWQEWLHSWSKFI